MCPARGNNGKQGTSRGILQVAAIDTVMGNRQGLRNWPTRLARAWFCEVCFVLFIATNASVAVAQDAAWKTGPAVRKELETPLGLTWSERSAREGLSNLAQSTGVAIWLDRRIDPDRKLTLKVADEPLNLVLLRVAEQLGGGVTLVGSVVYLGPKETTAVIATLATLRRQDVQKIEAAARAKLVRSEAWRWEELAEPRELLATLAERGGVTVQNAELMPHDLWPAGDFPATPWTERMTLLLAGFGLSYEFADRGTAIRLVPLPKEVTYEKAYTPRGDARDAAAQLARLTPHAKIEVEGSRLLVEASAEDHDKIDRLLKGERVKTAVATPGEQRYSLTVENQPAGAVVKTVATQLKRELKFSPEIREKLAMNVSFVAKDVPLDGLLRKALAPLGLSYKLDATTLEIVAAE